MKIYGDKQSGNCYKVQLACELLGLDYEWIDVDILKGETKSRGFLIKNPNGKIPLLEFDDINGVKNHLSESNAIINFLAKHSKLYPDDPFIQAQIQEWQFFEQYSHEPYIAVARFIKKYLGLPNERKEEYRGKHQGGYKALDVMEARLSKSDYLVGEFATTADLSLFAYTHVADEGGFDLNRYPSINSWLARVADIPGFVDMGELIEVG